MKALLIIRLIAGVVVAVALFAAGQEMMRAGRFMDIQSIGGQTLEEAFYQAYGMFAQALGVATMAVGGLALVISFPTEWPVSVRQPASPTVARSATSATVPSTPRKSLPTASAVGPHDRPRAACVRCGFSLPADAEFCPQCGVRQSLDKGGS